ncbi:MAG: methylmalonyl-CoA mutase N-terminal domain/subunit, partial [Myxococcota bacterium]
EISDSAFQFQRQVDRKERIIVGVNAYKNEDSGTAIPTLKIDETVELGQKKLLAEVKANRDNARALAAIEAVAAACRGTDNLMEVILIAVKADVTLGEICDVFRTELGVYHDPAFL